MLRLDSLAHPRTGIGYYTEHLCRELSLRSDVEVTGLFRGQLVQGGQLQQLLAEDDITGHSVRSRSAEILDRCKPLIRSLPGAYSLRQFIHDQRARAALSSNSAGNSAGNGESLYHEPNFVPLSFDGPLVVTVHDLSHLRYPGYHPAKRVRFLNRRLPAAMKAADLIITDSDFIRQEIASCFPGMEDKVVPIHLGVENGIGKLDAPDARQVLARYGLDYKAYILSVATPEPRKNLAGLLEAYDRLPAGLKSDLPLVLVGGGGWHTSRLYQLAESVARRGGQVIVTGRVPRGDLAGLLSGARLFAYPSFYEGFGLPIAEARACGTPVLTTSFGAMAEVAGPDAFLTDLENLAHGLRDALLTMPEQVPPFRFSWATTAEQTLDAYRRV